MLSVAIVLTSSPWLLMGLLTGMGVVWIVSLTIGVLCSSLRERAPWSTALRLGVVQYSH